MLIGATTTVGIGARLAVFVTATSVAAGDLRSTSVVGVLTAGLWFAQRALAAALRPELEIDLHRATARAVLEGDVIATPTDDLHRVIWEGQSRARALVADTLPALTGDLVATCVLAPLVLATFPSRLVIAATVALVVILATTLVLRGANARLQSAVLEAMQRVQDVLLLAIEGRLELVARGHEDVHARGFSETLDAYRRRARRAALASAVVGRVPIAAGMAIVALVVLSDAHLARTEGASVLGQALVLAAASPPVLGLVMETNQLARSTVAVRPFVDLLRQQRRAELASAPRAGVELPCEVTADALAFAYAAGRDRVLDGISFRWVPGEVLVLTGANGSGKSTLLRLLIGLRSPTSGALRFEGRSTEEIDLVALRRRTSFLPQRPYLGEAYATVRDALGIGVEGATDEAMVAALERAGVSLSLERGVGELSAGQRQRVALARVVLQDAALVLLDEPDANLDRDGVALVASLAKEWTSRGKMVAIAAHSVELAELDGVTIALTRL